MRTTLGVFAFVFYALHGAVHLVRGEPYDLLWGCHIAVLLTGLGLLLRNASLNAMGLLWACFGIPLWLLDAATGGEFMPTAAFTHIGALALGIYGVRLFGMPRGSAWRALAAYVGLWGVTRLVTPPAANINLAFRVQPGWEQYFASYPIYFLLLLAGGGATFVVCERLFVRIGSNPSGAYAMIASIAGPTGERQS
jgi:hypothetical protein